MGLFEEYKNISRVFALHGGKVDDLSYGGFLKTLTTSEKPRGEVDVGKTYIVVDDIFKRSIHFQPKFRISKFQNFRQFLANNS